MVTRRRGVTQVSTLDELLAGGRIRSVDFVKIDVEGAELAILAGGISLLREAVALKVECSFLEQRVAQPRMWEVADFIVGQGFEIVDLHDIHRWRRRNLPAHPYRSRFVMPYSRGQLAQGDLVALKSPNALNGVHQGLRLVVVASALGHFDHAITVIRSLPELATQAQREYSLDLEEELIRWSALQGKRAVIGAIREELRTLVPLFKALIGRLPFHQPEPPY